MIRVDIETIVMAAGPHPSLIVLRERETSESNEAPLRALSIQTGSFEAAALSQGIDGKNAGRPITHDFTVNTIKELGAKIARVEISHMETPVFFANVIILDKNGEEHAVDARPSDALAFAVRVNAPIYVEDDIMNRAGTFSYQTDINEEAEQQKFDHFVQTLSPDDF